MENEIINIKRQTFVILLVSIIQFLNAFFYFYLDIPFRNIVVIIWILLGVLYFAKYISFIKNGYIKIAHNKISINLGELKDTKTFLFTDIKEVHQKPNSYTIVGIDNRKVKISNFSIKKQDFHSFLSEMNAIKDLVNNKT